MKIKKIYLRNFRNYKKEVINFSDYLNIIIGENGQGKTNLIEAINFLSVCKSHRVNNDLLLINKNENFFDIQVLMQDEKIYRIYLSQNGKSLFINKQNISKVSAFIGNLNAILFSPDDLNLFNQTPKYRRKFIDVEIGKISTTYTKVLNDYYLLLKNRNLYLKNSSINYEYLDTLTNKMVEIQLIIMFQRKKFIDDLLFYANEYYKKITKSDQMIQCEYCSIIDIEKNDFSFLKQKYEDILAKDIKLKQTHLGIHRDDFLFKIDNEYVIEYLSQGQKRIVLLCLKLGLVKLIHKITKKYPVLLLDDIFSELDICFQKKILQYIPKDVQIFISTCNEDLSHFQNIEMSVLKIENGRVKGE